MSVNDLPGFAGRYFERFESTWTEHTPIDQVRFVVVDTETTGLDPRRDRLITIGAVGVQLEEIVLADSFEELLKIAYNTSSVTVHGITREEARNGLDEPEVIESFLDYLQDGVIVGHHIAHDIATINAACERHFGFELKNRFLDTMDLTLHLRQSGAFDGRGALEGFSLDLLCNFFDVAPRDRHTAGGDAFITALVFLRLLHSARRYGRGTLGLLSEPYLDDSELEHSS